jgi:phage antirepressor YoqD-like protein
MNELTTETRMTTKEVADFLKTSSKVVLENAKKCMPDKVIENGKTTYWNKAEVTVLLDCLKNNPQTNSSDLYLKSKGYETDLTPALKLKKAMELAQEAYEEELERLKLLNEQQEQKLIEQAPKIDFYDSVTGSTDTINMSEVAKVLNCGLGRNQLFELLRKNKILDRNNQPYQQYVDRGYFRIIETKYTVPDGTTKISLKTVVFQKGLDFIRKLVARGIHDDTTNGLFR